MYGSTQVESPFCLARSQICTQYMLAGRFVRACHLALVCHSLSDADCTCGGLGGGWILVVVPSLLEADCSCLGEHVHYFYPSQPRPAAG